MKTLSAGLDAHLLLECTTLRKCWKATLRDGAVFGFTEHVADIVFGGVTYVANAGFQDSAVQTSAGFAVDDMEVLGALDPNAMGLDDLRAGRWDFADVEIFQVNYQDLTQGSLPLRKGTLGQVTTLRHAFRAELLGMTQRLTQNVGRLYLAACDADLGDTRCGVNLTTFPRGIVAGTVTAVFSRLVFAESTLPDADGWFDSGKVTFTSGANTGYAREIKTWASGQFALQEAMPFPIVVGNTFNAQVGCLKRFVEDCTAKFNNAVNFRGFPSIPGTDKMITGQ